MAKNTKITHLELENASKALSYIGESTRSSRTVSRFIPIKDLNRVYEFYVDRIKSLYGADDGDISYFRKAFVEELVRGSNLMPSGSKYGEQLDDIYNKALKNAAETQDADIQAVMRQMRNNIDYLSQDENFRAIYYLFDEARSLFVDKDPKEAHGGVVAWRTWYYQYVVERGKSLNYDTLSDYMSPEQINDFADAVRRAPRDKNGRPLDLTSDKKFMKIVSDVSELLADDALSKRKRSINDIFRDASGVG